MAKTPKFKVNRKSKETLTDQAERHIRTYISKGKKGDVLPSERRLADEAGIARNCVRGAFLKLEKAGLIRVKDKQRVVAKAAA